MVREFLQEKMGTEISDEEWTEFLTVIREHRPANGNAPAAYLLEHSSYLIPSLAFMLEVVPEFPKLVSVTNAERQRELLDKLSQIMQSAMVDGFIRHLGRESTNPPTVWTSHSPVTLLLLWTWLPASVSVRRLEGRWLRQSIA